MKRFAYICADPGIPVPGGKGSSIHVESVCRELVRAGLSGAVFCARAEDRSLCGLPVHSLARPKPRTGEEIADRETRLFLSGFDGEIVPDDGWDFIYERYSLWHVGGLARARALGVPFFLEVNSPLPEEARRFRGLVQEDLANTIARLVVSEADGVVCVSDEVADWVVGLRGSRSGVRVVPNGVDPDLFSPEGPSRRNVWPDSDAPVVVFSGSFRPWHGTSDLLEAFRLVVQEQEPDAHLLCVGDGPLRAEFEREVRRADLSDRVRVTGLVPQHEAAAWLRGAAVAVAPCPAMQGYYFSPLKIFEFLALGLPLVAGDVGQIARVVPHGERSLLYAPGDTRGLADAIGRLLRDRKEAQRLADAGRAWVLANATWDSRVASVLGLIHETSAARSTGATAGG